MSVVTKVALKAKFETGDFPTQQDFEDFVDTVYPYEKYIALITQAGTAAPTIVELENTLGITMIPTRISPGVYRLTRSTGSFTNEKTWFSPDSFTNTLSVGMRRASSTSFEITTNSSDDILSNTPIEIRVYP